MPEHSNCDTIVHQLVEVETQVTVTPNVKNGKPKIYCVESDLLPCCDSEKDNEEKPEKVDKKCCFVVTQVICVEIPIMFDVDVDVDKGIAHCCKPDFGPCELREFMKPSMPSKPQKQHKAKESVKAPTFINLLSPINLRNLRNLLNKCF